MSQSDMGNVTYILLMFYMSSLQWFIHNLFSALVYKRVSSEKGKSFRENFAFFTFRSLKICAKILIFSRNFVLTCFAKRCEIVCDKRKAKISRGENAKILQKNTEQKFLFYDMMLNSQSKEFHNFFAQLIVAAIFCEISRKQLSRKKWSFAKKFAKYVKKFSHIFAKVYN